MSKFKIPNTFLRKKRKFPNSPFKSKWHFIFNQQQSVHNLKKLASSSQFSINQQTPNPNKTPLLLQFLIDSFKLYDCEATPEAYRFVIKTLIRNSLFKDLNLVLTHLEISEKFETPERIFVDLIRVYGEKGMFKEAIDLFFRVPKFRCVPTVYSLNSLLYVLCRSREFIRVVPQILLKGGLMKIRIEESSLGVLIGALCRIGKVNYAIRLLNYMIDDGLNPDYGVYSMILSSLCEQKGVTSFELLDCFERMIKFGFCPSRVDYSNLIKFLVREGKGVDELDVLGRMKSDGMKPDIACYTMALRGAFEGGCIGRAEGLFDELLVFGLVPDVHTYNVYIRGLCKENKVEAGYKMAEYMEELGCKPDIGTYNILLEAFLEVKELSRAKEVWKEMKLKGLKPNVRTYRTMVDVLVSAGEIGQAVELMEKMLSKGLTPHSWTLDEMICRLCEGDSGFKALHMLEEVARYGVVPGLRGWEALLLELKVDVSLNESMTNNGHLVNPEQ